MRDAVPCQVAGTAVALRALRASKHVPAAAVSEGPRAAVHWTQQHGQQVVQDGHLLMMTAIPVLCDVTNSCCCCFCWDEVILSVVRRQRMM